MTDRQQHYIGDVVLMQVDADMAVQVKVVKVIQKFGKFRYVVEPVAGKGTATVETLYKIKK